ncbi:MAG: hypothetical protein U0800_24755 [Isosphaeraceae bacterium]
MATPSSIDARYFYRCAVQRFEDAEILLRADRTTGAVYLAGYGVECTLKGMILGSLPAAARKPMLDSFRGAKAHDFEWLRLQYLDNGGSRFPREVNQAFTLVGGWSTDLRYSPRTARDEEAEGFLNAGRKIIGWGDGRH